MLRINDFLAKKLFCVLVVFWVLAFYGLAKADSLVEMYEMVQGGKSLYKPTEQEWEQARELFEHLFESAKQAVQQDAKKWEKLGFCLQDKKRDGQELVILKERKSKNGRGWYLFAGAEDNKNVLMIPHGQKDYYTGELGLRFFKEGSFKAGAWNTLPRYGETARNRDAWDLAHQDETYFTAFTSAAGQALPEARIIQVHGFAREKRRSEDGASANVILSAGSSLLPAHFQHLGQCLKHNLQKVRVYPLDVRELGGTTNICGKILRSMGHRGFIHLELAYPLRSRLRKDKDLRNKIIGCLQESQ
jgi:hypothetical protein